jgi:DNA-binding Xre family transcriptional regulator
MIIFDRLWNVMKERDISTYRLREMADLQSRTIKRLQNNLSVETKTLDRICKALDCELSDIAEFVKDE